MIVVSDTSPISSLIRIGRLDLLKDIFQKVVIPSEVHKELLEMKNFGWDLSIFENADWIETRVPSDTILLSQVIVELDRGEAEAITLAKELNANYLLIDERKGWDMAKSLGINAIGLVSVLIQAKTIGYIPLVRPVLDELREKGGFWMGKKIYQQVLQIVNE
ncbi:MAG: DUF3368 domain-containing protein [Lewinellaceae bacterium]|nr:DUF3368 domain-containing protein [Saprospiraceae bacterium]MCB9339158.1 DUF3368 domain-containing protein [Lewinellaceae bacterium]